MKDSFKKAVFSFKTKILGRKLHRQNLLSKRRIEGEDLEHYNLEQRRRLIAHAIQHSSFYRTKYKDLDSETLSVMRESDFIKLPPLSREELRANLEGIKADTIKGNQVRMARTSGSTSEPLTILHDRRRPETPIRWRILNWWGIEPWENQAFVYRYDRPFRKKFLSSLLWWPTKRIFFGAADFDYISANHFIAKFNQTKPALLQGYVDVVYELALYLLDNDIAIHPPKMVWVTSAPLFEKQRKLIEKAFGAPVCDQYGNTEILLIAAECPQQKGLHIMKDTIHIEFVDEQNRPVPAGTTGKILLTDLTNLAFPLIRYDIGDLGRSLNFECNCDIPLPLMDNVRGRLSLTIRTPSGLQIKGEHFMVMFDMYMSAFKEIQLKQAKDYSVGIYFVPRDNQEVARLYAQEMVGKVKKRSRHEIEVYCKQVAQIERTNAKTPLIVSEFNDSNSKK